MITHLRPTRIRKTKAAVCEAILPFAVVMAGASLFGQDFDAISVVRHIGGAPGKLLVNKEVINPQTVQFTGTTIRELIRYAYNIRSVKQVQGGPAWLDETRYDVEGKSATPATPAQQRVMMVAALADRFHLRVHFEKRDTDVYYLKAPHGIRAVRATSQAPAEFSRYPVHSRRGDDIMFTYTETSVTMSQLADWLWFRLACPVLNQTGLDETFDFTLKMSADDAMGRDTQIEAVEKELGLRIVPGKAPIDTLVVDGISTPSAN